MTNAADAKLWETYTLLFNLWLGEPRTTSDAIGRRYQIEYAVWAVRHGLIVVARKEGNRTKVYAIEGQLKPLA